MCMGLQDAKPAKIYSYVLQAVWQLALHSKGMYDLPCLRDIKLGPKFLKLAAGNEKCGIFSREMQACKWVAQASMTFCLMLSSLALLSQTRDSGLPNASLFPLKHCLINFFSKSNRLTIFCKGSCFMLYFTNLLNYSAESESEFWTCILCFMMTS
ncbi:hypothetical protein M758_4G241500 [Ceratodon purpureus]|nr:hypothetical protein M758_4G241500 [Ceratodon purpureus]